MEKYQFRTMSPIVYVAYILLIIIAIFTGITLFENNPFIAYIFGILSIGIMIYVVALFLKESKRKRLIEELISREDYRNIVVAGIDQRSTGGKNPQTYYVYFCEDPQTKNIYETDWIFDIENSEIKMGDLVRLYESHTEKDIFWVDISHRESGKGLKKLSREAKILGEESFKEVEKEKNKSQKFKLLYLVIIIGLFFLFSWISYLSYVVVYQNSIEVVGTVTEVTKDTTTCGRKYHRVCTQFHIVLDFVTLGKNKFGMYPSAYIYEAYSVSGKDQPFSLSKYQKGDTVEVLLKEGSLNTLLIVEGVSIKESFLRKMQYVRNLLLIEGGIFLLLLSIYLYQKFIIKNKDGISR